MQPMDALRRMNRLARLVLAGFLLSLGVAIASPAVQPTRLEMICSGGVMKLLAQDDASTTGASLLDCPLCLPGMAPAPGTATLDLAGPGPVVPGVARRPLPHVTLAAPPLPARGPPANSSFS